MVELTFRVPFTLLIFSTYLFYHALINYVIHSKLELKFASQKTPHILLDPPSKLGFNESIKSRMFEFSWSSAITPTPYAYPNLLNKKASTPSEHKYHIVCTTFLVFVDVGEN
jgi:hypothetical protein